MMREKKEKNISRRTFLMGSAAGALGMAVSGMSLHAAADEESSNSGEEWDYTADLAVVGSGTAMFGVIEALHQGYRVVVIEKLSFIGGTTITSGGVSWIPGNHLQGKDGLEADLTEDEILEYLKASDTWNGSTDEMKLDYIRNAPKVFEYVEDAWGYPMIAGVGAYGDYYNLPGCLETNSRCVRFMNEEDGSSYTGAQMFSNIFKPELEASDAATVLLKTTATELIQDETGRVIGVKAEDEEGNELRIKGEKGVLLAAGSFDRNKEMCRQHLRGPLYGTLVSVGDTGDGHRMGMAVGADVDNMADTLDGTVFIEDLDSDEYSSLYDWGGYRGTAYSMMVNRHGRRFANESAAYGVISDTFYQFDHKTYSLANIPGYLIFTDAHVNLVGWPDGESEQPDYVSKFENLDSLADAYGIDADNLKAEVERFNGFCETGVDEDFARGEGPHEKNRYSDVDGLVNKVLGPIEAPYYVALVGPASIGSCGGLKVNTDAQVLNVSGDVIEGLYASGCNSANPLGSSYAGGGASIGPSMYRAFRAVNHMFDLGII